METKIPAKKGLSSKKKKFFPFPSLFFPFFMSKHRSNTHSTLKKMKTEEIDLGDSQFEFDCFPFQKKKNLGLYEKFKNKEELNDDDISSALDIIIQSIHKKTDFIIEKIDSILPLKQIVKAKENGHIKTKFTVLVCPVFNEEYEHWSVFFYFDSNIPVCVHYDPLFHSCNENDFEVRMCMLKEAGVIPEETGSIPVQNELLQDGTWECGFFVLLYSVLVLFSFQKNSEKWFRGVTCIPDPYGTIKRLCKILDEYKTREK